MFAMNLKDIAYLMNPSSLQSSHCHFLSIVSSRSLPRLSMFLRVCAEHRGFLSSDENLRPHSICLLSCLVRSRNNKSLSSSMFSSRETLYFSKTITQLNWLFFGKETNDFRGLKCLADCTLDRLCNEERQRHSLCSLVRQRMIAYILNAVQFVNQ